jgi:hypothetical protein
MLKKIKEVFKKPSQNIITKLKKQIKKLDALPFRFGISNFSFTQLTFKPDSFNHFADHKEFIQLHGSFIKCNKRNNSGDLSRLWFFILNIKQILSEGIQGDFAELGVWRGNTASVLAYYASLNNRKAYLFDTFAGFDKRDLSGVDENKGVGFKNTSLDLVKDIIGKPSESCIFVKGHFPTTVTEEHRNKKFAIVSLDCDLYEPMKAGLEFFYPLMAKGGVFLLHDYSSHFWEGAKKAIDEFCAKNDERVILMPDKSGSALFRKSK